MENKNIFAVIISVFVMILIVGVVSNILPNSDGSTGWSSKGSNDNGFAEKIADGCSETDEGIDLENFGVLTIDEIDTPDTCPSERSKNIQEYY